MKTTKKLKRKHFRYLSKKEFKDPLYAIARICRIEIGLYDYWRIVNRIFIACSTASPNKIKTITASNLSFYCQQIMRNIELLYLLDSRFDDWKLDENATHYHVEFGISGAWIDDDTLSNGTVLYFKQLKKSEVKNIGCFLRRFFEFKSLRKWYKLMEVLHSTIFSESRFSEYFDYERDDAKIFNYLEKLVEATFLIYEIKAKAYIFKHHVEDFFLEKYLDDAHEPTEAKEEDTGSQQTEAVTGEDSYTLPGNPESAENGK